MKARVIHKGLLIVAVPLVIELVVIALLSYILALIDVERSLENDRRNLALNGARLTFGNCHAGVSLMQAWSQRDSPSLHEFFDEFKNLEKLYGDLRRMPQDTDARSRQAHQKCLEMESQLLKYFGQMSAVTKKGFSMEGFQRVVQIQKKMYRHLDSTFTEISRLISSVDRTLKAGQNYVQILEQVEVLILICGFVLTIFAAFALLIYFHKTFSTRIARISANIERIARREKPEPALEETDEIAELDQSFHRMWQQLSIASEHERALFTNSSDIICVLDENLRFVQLSNACKRLWGYAPEQLQGLPLSNYINEQALKQIETAESGSCSLELLFSKPAGDYAENLWTLSWSTQQKRWYGVVHDISEQKNAEAQRKRYLEQIAEDFQKPIQRISEHIEKLLAGICGKLPETATQKFLSSKTSLVRMIQLIKELKQMENLDPLRITLEKRSSNIKSVLQEAITELESYARVRGIRIEAELVDGQWHVDAGKMVRVIVNLLSNAIKFSTEGSCVVLSAVADSQNVIVSVQDSGRGMAEAELKKLFEPFHQTKAADGVRGKGTGLGLYICQKIVMAHGGAITVRSQEQVGSYFSILIPLASKLSVPSAEAELIRTEKTQSRKQPLDKPPAETETGKLGPAIDAEQNLKKANFWEQRDLAQKATILIGAPVLVATVLVIVMMIALIQGKDALISQMQRRELGSSALSMSTGLFEFATRISPAGRQYQREKLEAILDGLPEKISHFKQAAAQNVISDEVLKPIYSSLDYIQKDLQEVKNAIFEVLTDDGALRASSISLFAASDKLSKQVELLLDECEKKERKHEESQPAARLRQTYILDASLILNLWLAALLASYFSKDVAKRLKRMSDNAANFSANRRLSPADSGKDEIAALDRSFHETAQALKSAREKESAFLTNAQSLICALNYQGQFLTVNPAASRILASEPEYILKHNIYDFLSPERKTTVQRILDLARQSQVPVQFETEIVCDAAPHDLLWSAVWSSREENYFCTARDISAQKELERLKQRFTAIVTHDLRTPLSSLLGFAGLTQEGVYGEVPETALETLLKIRQEIDCILELVNDLLDLEKLQEGHLLLANEELHINDLILEAVKKLDRRLTVELESTVSDELRLIADRDRLSQVLASLILETQALGPDKIILAAEATAFFTKISITATGLASKSRQIEQIGQRLSLHEADSHSGSRLRVPLLLRLLEKQSGKLSCSFDGEQFLLAIILDKVPEKQNQS